MLGNRSRSQHGVLGMPFVLDVPDVYLSFLFPLRSSLQVPAMTPNEYQALAARTRCPQTVALARLRSGVYPPIGGGAMLLHGVIGLTGEVGELASAIEKYAWYGQAFDRCNTIEEVGDCLWYLSEILDALDIPLEQVMSMNIAKLKKRFPEKFTEEKAREENRDRENEVSHMVVGVDPAEPGTDKTAFTEPETPDPSPQVSENPYIRLGRQAVEGNESSREELLRLGASMGFVDTKEEVGSKGVEPDWGKISRIIRDRIGSEQATYGNVIGTPSVSKLIAEDDGPSYYDSDVEDMKEAENAIKAVWDQLTDEQRAGWGG